jgi:hypothetical protein
VLLDGFIVGVEGGSKEEDSGSEIPIVCENNRKE